MGNLDMRTKLIEEIDNMYIVYVFGGAYTKRGSFFASDESDKKFHAQKQLVEKKFLLFEMLATRRNPLWILVKNEVWGGKWGNIPVPEIVMISEQIEDCKEYKFKLAQRLLVKFDLHALFELNLKLIEDYGKPSFEIQEEELKMKISALQEKLSELNMQLNE